MNIPNKHKIVTIGKSSSPSIKRLILFTTSRISKLGILQDHPVPIPSAPFISTMGIIGIYHSGSTRWLSSYKNFNVLSSFGGNNNRAKGLKETIKECYFTKILALIFNFNEKDICYLISIHGFTSALLANVRLTMFIEHFHCARHYRLKSQFPRSSHPNIGARQ